MIHEKWTEFVDSLAEKGIPLYFVTDPLDDAGIPSWAIVTAIVFILFFAIIFVVFPGIKFGLEVQTNDGARVTVSYGEIRHTSKTVNNTTTFKIPLGATVNVKITKDGCEGESIDLLMIDDYSLQKQLICTK